MLSRSLHLAGGGRDKKKNKENSKYEMSDLTIQHGEGDEKVGGISILYKVVRGDLTGEVAFDQRPKGIKGTSMQISEGRTFQT